MAMSRPALQRQALKYMRTRVYKAMRLLSKDERSQDLYSG